MFKRPIKVTSWSYAWEVTSNGQCRGREVPWSPALALPQEHQTVANYLPWGQAFYDAVEGQTTRADNLTQTGRMRGGHVKDN